MRLCGMQSHFDQLRTSVLLKSQAPCLYSKDELPEPPKYLSLQRTFCGSMAGAVTKTVIAPLERIKIIHQTQGMSLAAGGKAEYHSILQSIKHILQKESFISLWNGNGANVIRVIPNYGLRFSFNDKAREIVLALTGEPQPIPHSLKEAKSEIKDVEEHIKHDRQVKQHQHAAHAGSAPQLSKMQLFLAGSLAGIAQISITYPAEVIFTRLSLSGSSLSTAVKYNGIMDCISRTLANEGPRALYNGYLPTLLSGTPYVALQMTCYELFQRALPKFDSESGKIGSKLVSGALAGLVAQTVTFPGDVVRKRMQSDGMNGQPKMYKGLIHATKTIYQREGLRGFFDGVRVNSWRCLPEGAIMFVVFDMMKKGLNISQYDAK